MSNRHVLEQLNSWNARVVFVKITVGNKSSGRYGLSDNITTVLSDYTVVENAKIVCVGDEKLTETVKNATRLGIHYSVWMQERARWMDMAANMPYIRSRLAWVIQSFDDQWQRVAFTFINSPPRFRRPPSNKNEPEGATFEEVMACVRNDKVCARSFHSPDSISLPRRRTTTQIADVVWHPYRWWEAVR